MGRETHNLGFFFSFCWKTQPVGWLPWEEHHKECKATPFVYKLLFIFLTNPSVFNFSFHQLESKGRAHDYRLFREMFVRLSVLKLGIFGTGRYIMSYLQFVDDVQVGKFLQKLGNGRAFLHGPEPNRKIEWTEHDHQKKEEFGTVWEERERMSYDLEAKKKTKWSSALILYTFHNFPVWMISLMKAPNFINCRSILTSSPLICNALPTVSNYSTVHCPFSNQFFK